MPQSYQHQRLADLLDELETELRRVALWEADAPSAEALASVQPFAVDTLEFSQWLQFVFIARLRDLAAAGGVLPQICSVQPMAEESLKGMGFDVSPLLALIAQVDTLLSGGSLH